MTTDACRGEVVQATMCTQIQEGPTQHTTVLETTHRGIKASMAFQHKCHDSQPHIDLYKPSFGAISDHTSAGQRKDNVGQLKQMAQT